MKLEEYQIEANKTLVDLGSKEKNIAHCTCGIFTELGELMDIFKKNLAYGKDIDQVHVLEEYGDIQWYFVNLCTIKGLSYTNFENLEPWRHRETPTEEMKEDIVYKIAYILIGGNMLYDSIEDNKLSTFYVYLEVLADILKINIGEAYAKNIKKLRVRYKSGNFTNEAALDRDLTGERDVLES